MTTTDTPADPSVLNTTVLSNFAYIDQLWVVAGLSGICTVPVVREELHNGVDGHPSLQSALNILDDEIPVATVSDTVANREAVVSDHLDPGETQAFALADAHDGRLQARDTCCSLNFQSLWESGRQVNSAQLVLSEERYIAVLGNTGEDVVRRTDAAG